jgi:phosphoglucosamine mutase
MESARLGRARRIDDAAGRYIEFCKSTFPNALDLRGLRIAVDCAHGAAYHIAPKVFHELGAEIVGVGVTPNGMNINDGVGATSPETLCRAVREHHADIGIALDGDADRVMMADRDGRLYDGDQLLYVIARHRHAGAPVAGVAGTLMTNLGFEHALARLGIPFARARVGDRYVLELLQAKGWFLGGENSGHILCLDKHTTGDGIISALQVLGALRARDETLGEACRELSMYPQKLINVHTTAGFDWQADAGIKAAAAAAEKALAGRGRVLLRPSGTEPVLRVMVEGSDGALVNAQAELIAGAVRAAGKGGQG